MEISTGIEKEPHFIILYGTDGIGKTTFAAEAPSSIIVGPESGSKRINVSRAKNIFTYADVVKSISWLREQKHGFKSLGLDSLDWIEPLVWSEVCARNKVDSIEDVKGGYGKGYTESLSVWGDLICRLKDLRESRQMNIICIAHSQVKTVSDPMQPLPYDRHMMKLNEKASAKWREAVDAVLFATFEDTVFKVNAKDKKAKCTGDGVRKIFTTRRAAWDAKNRLGLPPELPLSYSAFDAAANQGTPDSLEQVMADLKELGEALSKKDKESGSKMTVAVEAAKDDVTKLINIRNHARVLVEE